MWKKYWSLIFLFIDLKKVIMAKAIKKTVVVEETIMKKIIFLRDEKIMLDVHLAELYGV